MSTTTIDRGRVANSHEADISTGPATIDDLTERARQIVYAGGVSVAEACRETLSSLTPDEDAIDRLLMAGLSVIVGGQLGADRSIPDEDTERIAARFQHRGLHGKARMTDILARLNLMGADGLERPLIDFTLADCVRFRQVAGSYVTGWTKRRDAMAMAARLLQKAKADRIGALPEADLAGVRDAVRAAWSA